MLEDVAVRWSCHIEQFSDLGTGSRRLFWIALKQFGALVRSNTEPFHILWRGCWGLLSEQLRIGHGHVTFLVWSGSVFYRSSRAAVTRIVSPFLYSWSIRGWPDSFESVPSPIHKCRLPWIDSSISRGQVSLADSRCLFLEAVLVFLHRTFGVSIENAANPESHCCLKMFAFACS